MHLLFLSSLLPQDNPASGFEIANAAIVAAYRRLGVAVTPAGFRRPGAPPAREGEIDLGSLDIENARVSRARKALWVAKALASGLPVSAAKLTGLGRADLVARLESAGPLDGLVLNSVQMPAAYPFLATWKPSIFVAHNVEHRSARENAAAATGRVTRALYAREARLLEAVEARLCAAARVVHTLSREDKAGLGLGAAPHCLPLALTIGRPQRADDGARERDIGLIGTWSWAPNRHGLDWFVAHVAPRLPADMTVSIAGRFDGPPPAAPANVRFVGRVEDAQDFVRRSRVIALATRGGTGIQLKTIETFEEGMPAVATPQALRGVDALPSNVRVAEAPADFAAALVALVEAERRGETIRGEGGAFARAQGQALDRALAAGLESFGGAGRSRRAAVPARACAESPPLAAPASLR